MEGSKEIFEKYQEKQIHTLVSMPYGVYKTAELLGFEMKFIKHFNPQLREKFKKNKRWADLEKTKKESRAEQREIESEIRVDGIGS